MKDDEGTIEVFIAMARMRVLRCCNLEGRLRVGGAEGTGGRRRLKGEKQYNMGKCWMCLFYCKDSVGVISLHRKQGHPKLSQK